MADEPSPIDVLMGLGAEEYGREWPDYPALGLGPEHVPDLLRIATDRSLIESEDEARSWAPVHASRALGQLRSEAAIGPLIDRMGHLVSIDEDFLLGEAPRVLAMIGPPAIAPLADLLLDEARNKDFGIEATDALEQIGQAFPETRDEIVAILSRQLARKDPRIPDVNGFIISDLVALKATEAEELIREAFDANVVDLMVQGNWAWVRHDLGLGLEPEEHRYPQFFRAMSEPTPRKHRPDPKRLLKRQAQKDARKRQRPGSKRRKRS
jgi:hypothetical protein